MYGFEGDRTCARAATNQPVVAKSESTADHDEAKVKRVIFVSRARASRIESPAASPATAGGRGADPCRRPWREPPAMSSALISSMSFCSACPGSAPACSKTRIPSRNAIQAYGMAWMPKGRGQVRLVSVLTLPKPTSALDSDDFSNTGQRRGMGRTRVPKIHQYDAGLHGLFEVALIECLGCHVLSPSCPVRASLVEKDSEPKCLFLALTGREKASHHRWRRCRRRLGSRSIAPSGRERRDCHLRTRRVRVVCQLRPALPRGRRHHRRAKVAGGHPGIAA